MPSGIQIVPTYKNWRFRLNIACKKIKIGIINWLYTFQDPTCRYRDDTRGYTDHACTMQVKYSMQTRLRLYQLVSECSWM